MNNINIKILTLLITFICLIFNISFSPDQASKLVTSYKVETPVYGKNDTNKQIEVTFISNCGFLVKVGDKKILFDLESPESAFDKSAVLSVHDLMYSNKPPFNNITAILISHSHADHVGAKELVKYLNKNRNVKLYSTADTKSEFKKSDSLYFDQIEKNIIVIDPYKTGILEKTIEGIKIEFLGLYHAGAPNYIFNNLSFVLEFVNASVFYMSDIDPGYEKNIEIIKKWADKKERIDLLFSPDVNLYKNRWSEKGFVIVKEYIKPKNIIAMHINPKEYDEAEKKVKENFPYALVFRRCMEKKIFK
jgi:L-ascorbate metabolism protein UlaG (beta-lactamase superfamily)